MLPSPGPAEAAVLADLAPTYRVRPVETRAGALRVLEGGEGPPLVLLHGRGSAATSWSPILPALSRSRRVLAVDLPGFGASRGHPFTGGDAERALAFFVDPLEAWLVSEGADRGAPVIMGHSLGGLCAIELALRGRVTPRALILIAPMGVGPEMTSAARLFFQAGPERAARLLGARLFGAVMGARSALSHELHAIPGGRPDAARAFDVLAPLVGPVFHRRDRLASITAPTLIIGGERDQVFPAPLALAAAALLPDAELRMEATGHSPLDEAPARVLLAIEGFLARLDR